MRSRLRSVIALILLCTMLTGQVLISDVLGESDIPLFSNGDTVETTAAPAEETEAPPDAGSDTAVIPSDEGYADEVMLLGLDEDSGTGGLSVNVTSAQTGELSDGDKYSFTVSIRDNDLTVQPNIKAGDELTIKLPSFLTTGDMDAVLKNCFVYFERNYTYDTANNTLTLTFNENPDGAWVNVQFSISMDVDTIGYDGDGGGSIDVDMGGVTSGKTPVTVDTGTGTGEGSGSGSTTGEPYINKNIWSNYTQSVYSTSGNDYVMRDPDSQIGYSIAFGVNSDYSTKVTVSDDLSGGGLVLCSSSGDTNAALGDCFRLSIGGEQLTPTTDGTSLVYTGTAIGTVTISRYGTGFVLTCTDNPNADGTDSGLVNVVLRYYAKAVKDDISNNVSLSIDGKDKGSSSQKIRRYDNEGLVITKSIIAGGAAVTAVDITEQKEVTFRLTMTQYGTGSIYSNGDVISYDTLSDCFIYDANKATVQDGAPFKLQPDAANSQKINIVKVGDSPIATGVYTIEFTVGINLDELGYGETATNKVGNTVTISREAKLTVNKVWTETGVSRGDGAKFTLYNGNTVIADTTMTAGDTSTNTTEYVMYIDADKLTDGEHTYTLRETVAENSGYIAARDISVVIKKTASQVTIVSIDGKAAGFGAAAVTVQNVPDSGVGSLTFTKTGDSGELIDGGTYQLYKVTDGAAVAVGDTFNTADGVKVFSGLEYGVYYIKEISAPAGYVIGEVDSTSTVELKKTDPHQSVSLVNTLYRQGSITITKKDNSGSAIAGVTFTLFDSLMKELRTATTGSDGVCSFTGLTAGTYFVRETVPLGYSGFAGPASVVIKTDGSAETVNINAGASSAYASGSTVSLNWTNVKLYGSIKITKFGAGGAVLAGAKFTLTGNGITQLEGTTNASGVVSFTELPFGTYTLTETEAPEGYVISSELRNGVSLTVNSETALERSYTNTTRKGSIELIKTDADTDAVLAGAKFELQGNGVSMTATTGSDGKCSFTGLEAGTYTVSEIQAPTGYVLSSETLTFVVGVTEDAHDGDEVIWDHSRTVMNSKRMYEVRVKKTAEDGTTPLAGAVFTLTGNNITKTAESGSDGVAVFTQLPFGSYTITETTAPAGYTTAAPITVTVDGNSANTVVEAGTVTDTHTALTVLKVDDKDQSRGLANTHFVIMCGDKYVTASLTGGVYVYTGLSDAGTDLVTGENGTFTLEYIPMGSYTLVETAAPEGYIISEAPRGFTVSRANDSLTVGNTQISAGLHVVKTDEYGKLLEGVGFTLETAEGFVQGTGSAGSYAYAGISEEEYIFYTNSSGVLNVSGLLWGGYTLSEAVTPTGLVPVSESFTITSEQHGTTVSLSPVDYRVLENIEFNKIDEDANALGGAVFKLELLDACGSAYADTTARYAVSSTDGTVRFENVPYGIYKLTEYLAPYGKTLSEDEYHVCIGGASSDGITTKVLPFDWVNTDETPTVTVRKVGADGEALSGAVFSITDKDGETVVKTLPVNEDGSVEVELPVGNYFLYEIKAPENYVMEETPISFKVTLAGPNVVTVKNAPYTGSLTITKTDADTGTALSGAEFKVYLKSDYMLGGTPTALYTATTNSDGSVTIDGIPFGTYAVVESKAPNGYELNTEAQFFTITNADGAAENSASLTFADKSSHYYITIGKADAEVTGLMLAGARFAVSGAGFYAEAEVGADGTVTVEVPAVGDYSVTEIEAPEGYTIDPASYTVSVEAHNVPALFTSLDYRTRVVINKLDENGQALDGAVFAVFRAEGGNETRMAFTDNGDGLVWDADGTVLEFSAGSIAISGLPVGSYILRELSAPYGYASLGDVGFTVDAGAYDEAVLLSIANLPLSRGVAVCKENTEGVRLAGAVFTLYDNYGNALQTVTTAASGYALFGDLGSGSYVIKETEAPAGYRIDETEYAFEIDGEGVLVSENSFETYGSDEQPLWVFTVTDSPIEHSFTVSKISGVSGDALTGAQFRILGNGVNRIFTTDDNGLTGEITLPVGEYMLTELRAPNGYIADGRSHFVSVSAAGIEIDGEDVGETAMYSVGNAPVPFRLCVVKQDETTGTGLEGAAFTVTGTDGVRQYLVTDENGLTDTITLQPGTYAVTESVAPAGYNLPLAGWSFTVEEGSLQVSGVSGGADHSFINGALTLTLTNRRTTGSLMICKCDADDESAPLAGAAFRVYDENGGSVWFTLKNGVYEVANDSTEGAGNVLTTNAMGQALLNGVEFGKYTVREISAPTGYELNADSFAVTLTQQDETVSLKVTDRIKTRQVTVIKQSADDEPENLIGAVFTLYSIAEDGSRSFAAEAVSLYDGTAKFEVTYGNYVIVESRAPAGYELSETEPYFFSFDDDTAEDAVFTHTFTNEKSAYAIEIYKYDAGSIDNALAGAEFAVTDSRGYTKVVTTGEDGVARLDDVVYGDYTIREIKAPDGYYLNDEVFTVAADELMHGKAVTVEVPDRFIIGTVRLSKVDYEDRTAELTGAEFVVYNSNGDALGWTQTEDGYALSGEPDAVTTITAGSAVLTGLPAGEYTIEETKAPDGYLKLDESRGFAVTAENAEAGIELVIENIQRKTAVGIIKMDSGDHSKRLEGAEFTLYELNEGKLGAEVTKLLTDSEGLAVFTGLTMGSYRIVETAAPEGYKLWENPLDFTIDADGNVFAGTNNTQLPELNEIYMAGVINESITREFTVSKVSADDGKALAGAKFTITGDGKTQTIVTGDKGTATVTLKFGEYTLKEVVAPDGYVLDETAHTVVVSADGISVDGTALEEYTFTVKNEPVRFAFTLHKQDASTAGALGGVKFTVSGQGESFELVTNAAGDTDTVYLKPGEYAVSETKAASGYKLPISGWKLTVQADGRASVSGDGAVTAVHCCSTTVTIDNVKTTGGSNIAKTGESGGTGRLAAGAAMVLLSFAGLVTLSVLEIRRRRYPLAEK